MVDVSLHSPSPEVTTILNWIFLRPKCNVNVQLEVLHEQLPGGSHLRAACCCSTLRFRDLLLGADRFSSPISLLTTSPLYEWPWFLSHLIDRCIGSSSVLWYQCSGEQLCVHKCVLLGVTPWRDCWVVGTRVCTLSKYCLRFRHPWVSFSAVRLTLSDD